MQQSASTLAPGLQITSYGYTFSLTSTSSDTFPSIMEQLTAIKASGIRIILLSAFTADVLPILKQADEMGLLGSPYVWVGTNSFCFDENLTSNQANPRRYFDGLLCTANHIAENNIFYHQFTKSWTAAYTADVSNTVGRAKPTISAQAYDAVLASVYALERLESLRIQCNLNISGSSGRPFTGLLPPDELAYAAYLYTSGTESSGSTIASTQSTVPTSAPDVCPWLLSQTGQGRVLTSLIRSTVFSGASGTVLLANSGDRMGDISFFNIYAYERSVIGLASAEQMLSQFSAITNNATVSDPAAAAAAGNSTGGLILPTYVRPMNGSDAWRTTYNQSTFSYAYFYQPSLIQISLSNGSTFAENGFSMWTPNAVKFADGTANVPLDSPFNHIVIQGASPAVRITVAVLAGLALLFIICLLIFQITYRRDPRVKIGSPVINCVTLIGGVGILVYTILLGFDSTSFNSESSSQGYVDLCRTKFGLLAVSFSIAFGSIFSKLYRE